MLKRSESFCPAIQGDLAAGSIDFYVDPVEASLAMPQFAIHKLYENMRSYGRAKAIRSPPNDCPASLATRDGRGRRCPQAATTVLTSPIYLVRRHGMPLTPLAEHFSDLIRRAAQNYAHKAV